MRPGPRGLVCLLLWPLAALAEGPVGPGPAGQAATVPPALPSPSPAASPLSDASPLADPAVPALAAPLAPSTGKQNPARGTAPQVAVARRFARPNRYAFAPELGFGFSGDGHTAGSKYLRIGADFDALVYRGLLFGARIHASFGARTYLQAGTLDPATGRTHAVPQEEGKWDLGFGMGYLFPVAIKGRRLELTPRLGFGFGLFDSLAFPFWYGGVDLGGGARFWLTGTVNLGADFGWVHNVFNAGRTSASLLGDAEWSVRYAADLGFRFGRRYNVRIRYEGETLGLAWAIRRYDGASLMLDAAF